MRSVYWAIWVVIGLVLELAALLNGIPNDSLTGVITSHIPGWLTFMGIGWLGWHFMVSYTNDEDER